MHTVEAKRISGATFFKLLLIGMVALHIMVTLIVMVLVVIGVLPTEATKPPITTTLGILLIYLVLGVITAPMWVGILWLSIWPGVWLYSLWRPTTLRYEAVSPEDDT